MGQFIQIHLLTSYPPSNLNRDDLGRPKTAVVGGVQRLRVSSQSLKRAWRTSPYFQEALAKHIGTRTKMIGRQAAERLRAGFSEKQAENIARKIAEVFGKVEAKTVLTSQLAHVSPAESAAVDQLLDTLIAEKREPSDDELKLLKHDETAVDISLFGRMLADSASHNVEASCQVAHAITVHRANVEDDYFTAVDDLNTGGDHAGAGHVGEAEFGSGVFYLYACIDRGLLLDNLGGNEDLVQRTLKSLLEAAAKVSPTGKQNSFASRAWASYILLEKGAYQPRSLSVAFVDPVKGPDVLNAAIVRLEKTATEIDKVYDSKVRTETIVLNALAGTGSFDDCLNFVAQPLEGGSGS